MGDVVAQDQDVSVTEIARFLREELLLPYYAQAVENSYIETATMAAVLQAAYQAHQENINNPQVHGLKVLLGCADNGLREAYEQMDEKDAMARHTQAAHDHVKKQLQELQTQYDLAKTRVNELQGQVAECQARIGQIQNDHAKTNSETMATIGSLTKTYHDFVRTTSDREKSMVAQIAEKDGKIAELTRAVNTNNPSAVTHSHTPRRKTTDPEIFTAGQDSAEKRQQKYETWAAKIDAVLLQDAAHFPANRDRIIYICGLLGGTAFEFIKEGLKTVTENPYDSTKWTWPTARDLRTALDNRYVLVDSAQIARNKLDDKKSWQGTRQYQEWKSELDDLLHKARQTEEQKVASLKKRINPELGGKVSGVPDQPPIDNYAAWSEFVGKLARNLVDQKHMEKMQPKRDDNNSYYAPKNAGQADRQQQPAGDPMDLDRIDHRIAHISQEERDYRFNNNLCLACGQPGHRVAAHKGPNGLPMPPRPGSPNPRGGRGRGGGRAGYGRGGNGRGGYQQPQYQPQAGAYNNGAPQNYQPRFPARQYYGPQFTQAQLRAVSPAGFVLGEDDASTTTSYDQEQPGAPDRQSKDTPLA